MLCPACGSKLSERDRVCKACGTLLIHGPKVRNEASFNTPSFNTLEDGAKKALEEETAGKKAAEEAVARKAAEEAANKIAAEAAKKAAEAAAAKKEAEEAARKAAAEAAARKAAEEAARKAAAEAAAKKAAAEAEKKAAAKKAAEEAARKAEEEAEKKAAARKAAEEAEKKAAEEAEKKAAARKAAEEAAGKAAEEAAAIEAAIESAIKTAQETAAKRAADEAAAAAEAEKKAAEEAAANKAAGEAAVKKAAEEAAGRKGAEKAGSVSPPYRLSYKIIGGNFPYVSVTLDEGQGIFTQSDAMVWMSSGIDMVTDADRGGPQFTAAYTSRDFGQEIGIAGRSPGEILVLNIGGNPVIVQKKAFLAAQQSIALSAHVSMNMGDEHGAGVFFQRLSGAGTVFIAAGGCLIERALGAGETIKADIANIAAFEESVSLQTRIISDFKNTVFGQGLFLSTLAGPGKVWLQTHV